MKSPDMKAGLRYVVVIWVAILAALAFFAALFGLFRVIELLCEHLGFLPGMMLVLVVSFSGIAFVTGAFHWDQETK